MVLLVVAGLEKLVFEGWVSMLVGGRLNLTLNLHPMLQSQCQLEQSGRMAAPDNTVLNKYEQMMRLMEDVLGLESWGIDSPGVFCVHTGQPQFVFFCLCL